MSVAVTPPVLTTEELLALPDDGVERWLIRGQLREMPRAGCNRWRDRWHSRVMVRVSSVLESWLENQPEPRRSILCGDAGVRLRREPDTTVGIDVVYVPPDVVAREPEDTSLIDGVPVLAVEILSPSDMVGMVDEKIDCYLAAGVPLVWVIDPHFRTVAILRPGAEPELVNVRKELAAEPHLPGFRVPAAQLFV
jgi:Uma2 family endonuclease